MADQEVTGMRERILEKATALFVSQGYNGISMREIAEDCGLSKPGLYYHFKDKEDLLLSILRQNLDLLEGLLDQVETQGKTPAEQIRLFISAIFTHLPAGRRSIIRLASQEMDKISPSAREDFRLRYEEQFLGRIKRILDAGVRSGEFREIDSRMGVWSLLGLMYPFMNHDDDGNVDYVVAFITMIFLEGVQSRQVL